MIYHKYPMHFEISSIKNSKFTTFDQISDSLFLNLDIGWTVYKKIGATVYFKGYQLSEYTDTEFIDQIIENPIPHYNGLFIAIICYGNKIVITFDLDRGTHLKYNPETLYVSTMVSDDRGTEVLGGKDYIVIENNSLSIRSYNLPEKYFNFTTMTEDEVISSIDKVIRTNFENMLSKNKDNIIVMVTGGVDTVLAFSYLKEYTNNYKILTYEHIDFTEFICKNWALFKKRSSSEGLLHFHGRNLILSGGWGDERLIRDPRMNSLNFRLHGSSILDEIKEHVGEYQYNIALSPAYKAGYAEQEGKPSLNQFETYSEIYNIGIHVRNWGHVEENIYFSPLKDLQLTNYTLRLPYEVQKKQFFDGYLSKKLIERNDPDLLNYVSKYKNLNCFENVYKLFEKYKDHTVTHTF